MFEDLLMMVVLDFKGHVKMVSDGISSIGKSYILTEARYTTMWGPQDS